MTDFSRLFLAIWPDSSAHSKLTAIQDDLRLNEFARCTYQDNLHLTLLFFGDVPQADLGDFQDQVQSVQFSPFTFNIDRVGFWPHNRVIWAGCTHPSQKLLYLAELVGIAFPEFRDKKRAFTPHVTLARKASKRIGVKIEPIKWHVDRIQLVQSQLGQDRAHYKIIESRSPNFDSYPY